MKLNSTVTKVLAATVAAGAVALGAAGAGTASADYIQYIPGRGPVVIQSPAGPLNLAYNTPYLVNGRWVYPYQYQMPQYQMPFLYPVHQNVYAPAVTATQFSFITATAGVLNMNRGDVVLGLQQGKTLTGIAAERGIQRVTLYNAIINTMRGSINVAVSSGAVNQMTGNVLQTSLNNRAGIVIDQPGTSSGTNAAAIETAYQLF